MVPYFNAFFLWKYKFFTHEEQMYASVSNNFLEMDLELSNELSQW